MPNKNGKSLANRLNALAAKQSAERLWKKNFKSISPGLQHIKTHAEYNEWIKTNAGQAYLHPKPATEPMYQNMPRSMSPSSGNSSPSSESSSPKVNCGKKPSQFIGTRRNPAFNEWKAKGCNTAAKGGKRKGTRKSKKSRRMTRKRR